MYKLLKNTRRASKSSAVLIATAVLLQSGGLAVSDEMIPRALLIDMARKQFSVMCQSETFAACMGFSAQQCTDLSETAVKQCLLTLPEKISPDALDNDSLESCPQKIFEDAGFSEEQAGDCFDKAMQTDS